MTHFEVKVNNLFNESLKTFIDPISKCYIIIESILGANRSALLIKGAKYFFLIYLLKLLYSFTLSFAIAYIIKFNIGDSAKTIGWICLNFQYFFNILFGFVFWRRLDEYYRNISEFDTEIGCRPKLTSDSVRNVVIVVGLVLLMSTLHMGFSLLVKHIPITVLVALIVIDAVYCIELSYQGHLLSLLLVRLRLMNYYMESALSSRTRRKRPDVEELVTYKHKKNKNSGIREIKDFYLILIKSFDSLINALKWQLLVILISMFVRVLTTCYGKVIRLIHSEIPLINLGFALCLTAMQLFSLFSPCVFADRVHGEVRYLRELIATRLYEKKLDKMGRRTARALLSLTEARDLSFSLLRMLQIDVSLPFKFIGLLITYLIILVQFDKVINPTFAREN